MTKYRRYTKLMDWAEKRYFVPGKVCGGLHTSPYHAIAIAAWAKYIAS